MYVSVCIWGTTKEDKQLRVSPELVVRVPSARHGLSAFLRLERLILKGCYGGEEKPAGAILPSFSQLSAQSWGSVVHKATSHGFPQLLSAPHLWRANFYENVPLSRNSF